MLRLLLRFRRRWSLTPVTLFKWVITITGIIIHIVSMGIIIIEATMHRLTTLTMGPLLKT
jgi:hypothetical protein